MSTSYQIRIISLSKDLKTKVVLWSSLLIVQIVSRQLATSSENLVASAQFLVALATSESQFRALLGTTRDGNFSTGSVLDFFLQWTFHMNKFVKHGKVSAVITYANVSDHLP